MLSRFAEISLLKTTSEQNGPLELKLVNGAYQLIAGEAVYSYGRKYHAFNEAFETLDLNDRTLSEVLVLGGGLGSVCEILTKDFEQSANFTLVEYDPIIIELAKQTMDYSVLGSCRFVNDDALNQVKSCSTQFDLLIVDLFESLDVPKIFMEATFSEALSSLLKPGGKVLFNFIATTKARKEIAELFYKDVFSKVFNQTKSIDGKGNLILCAQASE